MVYIRELKQRRFLSDAHPMNRKFKGLFAFDSDSFNLTFKANRLYKCRYKSTVNGRLTLLFRQTIQSVQNKDLHVVQIKPKAIKGFKIIITSGVIALHQYIE